MHRKMTLNIGCIGETCTLLMKQVRSYISDVLLSFVTEYIHSWEAVMF